jgi:hypothetical protein
MKQGSRNLEELEGKTFEKVYSLSNVEYGRWGDTTDQLIFENDEETVVFYHSQDCCESVIIEDICGNLKDLENIEILEAREDWKEGGSRDECDTHTWTFYNFKTSKGYVTVRWYGESNGYYSESTIPENLT